MVKYTRDELFSRAPIPEAMAALVLPTIIGQLITMAYNITDTFFVGQTGDPYQVAAVSLTFPIYHLLNALANLFGVGGGSLISRMLGEKRGGEAGAVSAFSFYAAIVTAVLFSLLTLIFMEPLLRLSGASDNTVGYSSDYLLWTLVLGGVPTMLSLLMAHLLRSEGRGKQAGRGMILGGLANIALDPIFIFTLGLEVEGAAIATFAANILSMIYYFAVAYGIRGNTVLSFRVRDISLERSILAPVFSVGLPAAIYVAMSSGANIVYNKLLRGFGDTAIAAAGIVKKLDMLPLNVCLGLSQGTTPLIAYNYASGDHKRMRRALGFSVQVGVGMCLFCVALFCWQAGGIVRLFIDDAETVRLGAGFLRIAILATPLMTVNILINTMFQAVGRGRESVVLSICRQGLINIPLMLLMAELYGLYGVISAQLAADAVTMAISVTMYLRFKKTVGRAAADG